MLTSSPSAWSRRLARLKARATAARQAVEHTENPAALQEQNTACNVRNFSEPH
jgi:hypothetical protein